MQQCPHCLEKLAPQETPPSSSWIKSSVRFLGKFLNRKSLLLLLVLFVVLCLAVALPRGWFYKQQVSSERYPYSLHVDSFRLLKEAQGAVTRLKRLGFESTFLFLVKGRGGSYWNQVHLGPWGSEGDAGVTVRKVQEELKIHAVLKQYPEYEQSIVRGEDRKRLLNIEQAGSTLSSTGYELPADVMDMLYGAPPVETTWQIREIHIGQERSRIQPRVRTLPFGISKLFLNKNAGRFLLVVLKDVIQDRMVKCLLFYPKSEETSQERALELLYQAIEESVGEHHYEASWKSTTVELTNGALVGREYKIFKPAEKISCFILGEANTRHLLVFEAAFVDNDRVRHMLTEIRQSQGLMEQSSVRRLLSALPLALGADGQFNSLRFEHILNSIISSPIGNKAVTLYRSYPDGHRDHYVVHDYVYPEVAEDALKRFAKINDYRNTVVVNRLPAYYIHRKGRGQVVVILQSGRFIAQYGATGLRGSSGDHTSAAIAGAKELRIFN